jgi:uncharacterized protein (UPF0264 family)
MRLLVSVRSVEEAMAAACGGADFIDLKEPGAGALGGLPVATILAIVAALRAQRTALPVSATIGDVPMDHLGEILARVAAVGACAVDYVKVGIESGPRAFGVLDALAGCGSPVVPVFLADRGIDAGLLEHASGLGFPAIMADTADKGAGSLLDLVSREALGRFVACVRGAGQLVGLAGALRTTDVPALRALGTDFAGFRSAVCVGHRAAALDPQRLRGLVAAVRCGAVAADVAQAEGAGTTARSRSQDGGPSITEQQSTHAIQVALVEEVDRKRHTVRQRGEAAIDDARVAQLRQAQQRVDSA